MVLMLREYIIAIESQFKLPLSFEILLCTVDGYIVHDGYISLYLRIVPLGKLIFLYG